MRCPKCETDTLEPDPTLAQAGLGAASPRRCTRCHGFWIVRGAVPKLQERGLLSDIDEARVGRAEGDRKNGLCPEGHGLLSRTRVTFREPYFLERCQACEGMWLDAGEWTRLSSEHLLEHLDDLWLPSWRTRLQDAEAAAGYEADLKSKLGAEMLERIHALGMELANHEHGDVALAYIRELVRLHRPRLREPD